MWCGRPSTNEPDNCDNQTSNRGMIDEVFGHAKTHTSVATNAQLCCVPHSCNTCTQDPLSAMALHCLSCSHPMCHGQLTPSCPHSIRRKAVARSNPVQISCRGRRGRSDKKRNAQHRGRETAVFWAGADGDVVGAWPGEEKFGKSNRRKYNDLTTG
jgi:hypothetical protein